MAVDRNLRHLLQRARTLRMYTIAQRHNVQKDCGKTFSSLINAQQHARRVHTPQKVACPDGCGKTFTLTANAVTHSMKVHHGHRAPCPGGCGKYFWGTHGAKVHAEAVHHNVRYPCPEQFGSTFASQAHEKFHASTIHHHYEGYICRLTTCINAIQRKPFLNKSSFKRFHMKKHEVRGHLELFPDTMREPESVQIDRNNLPNLRNTMNHSLSSVVEDGQDGICSTYNSNAEIDLCAKDADFGAESDDADAEDDDTDLEHDDTDLSKADQLVVGNNEPCELPQSASVKANNERIISEFSMKDVAVNILPC